MARLIISSPDGKRGILEITKPLVTIGRGSANDLVLNDSSVSRFHAVIRAESDGSISIADRGSTNGVLVAGTKTTQDTALWDGAVVRIGRFELKLEDVEERPNEFIVTQLDPPSTLSHVWRNEPRPETIIGRLHTDPNSPNLAEQLRTMEQTLERLERENRLLSLLYDGGKAVNSKLSIDDIADQVMQLTFRISGVERGFTMLFTPTGEVARQSHVRYRVEAPGNQSEASIILSRSILQRIRKEKQPILITDITMDERFSSSESLRIAGPRSAMCAPLVGQGYLLGILYVDNMQRAAAFTQEELNVFALVAAQAASAIDTVYAHAELAEQALQRSALERFLAPEVVEMVAANPEGVRLGGTNQMVSVLFADIRGFTPLSEGMDPHKVVEILNEYFTRVTDVIFDNGGTLDKYIGDAVMALFGAPISKGNDAARAVKTAVQIQRLLQEINRDSAARQWPELRVGIGINSGVVTAGNIGSPRRLDYTVIGDTVNTASRLMSKAGGNQIFISAETASQLGGGFDLEPLPPLPLKGKSEPVQVFSVKWSTATAAAASGDYSPASSPAKA